MDLRDYLLTLRRFWRTWLGLAIVGLLVGLGAAAVTPRTYTATARVFVSPTVDGTAGAQYVAARVKSYPSVATSAAVLGPVVDRLDLGGTTTDLAAHLSAANPGDSSQVVVEVTDRSPQRAAAIANAVAEQFETVVGQLEGAGKTSSPVQLKLTDPAVAPSRPSSPDVVLLLVVGGVVGLFLGLALAVLRSQRDPRVRDQGDLQAAWGATGPQPVVDVAAPGRRRGAATPAARTVRLIELLAEDRPARVLVLTPSADPRHRPAALAAQLADQLEQRSLRARIGSGPAVPAPTGTEQRVWLGVSGPMASLREWRDAARTYDAVVVAVAAGRVRRDAVAELRTALTDVGITPLALVLTAGRGRRAAAAAPAATELVPPARRPTDGAPALAER